MISKNRETNLNSNITILNYLKIDDEKCKELWDNTVFQINLELSHTIIIKMSH